MFLFSLEKPLNRKYFTIVWPFHCCWPSSLWLKHISVLREDLLIQKNQKTKHKQYNSAVGQTGSKRDISAMSTMFADTILIVFISVCTALLAEGEWNQAGYYRPGNSAKQDVFTLFWITQNDRPLSPLLLLINCNFLNIITSSSLVFSQ